MNKKETAQLCKCNNCDTIFYDENAGTQTEILIPIEVENMKLIQNDSGIFWGCPKCGTDDFLTDVLTAPTINLTNERKIEVLTSLIGIIENEQVDTLEEGTTARDIIDIAYLWVNKLRT